MNTFERIKIRKRETFHPDREKLGDNFVMPELDSQDIEEFIREFTDPNINSLSSTTPKMACTADIAGY